MGYRKITVKYRLEYAGLRVLVAFFNVIPFRAGLVVAWLVARAAFHGLRFRRREVRRRLEHVFKDRYSRREMDRIAWISIRNFLFNGVEVARLPHMDRAWFERHVEYGDSVERARQSMPPGRGGIFALPHMGHWDMAGVGGRLFGFPMLHITGRQHNPLTDRFMNSLRGATGVEILSRADPELITRVLTSLRQGRVLGILPDLRSRHRGITVRFLGDDANVFRGLAAFARETRVPIFPVVVTRVGWTRHCWRIFDPVEARRDVDRQADDVRMIQYVMDIFDRAIREEPEQYFWYNKRWVLHPHDPAR
jgi:lauroyl/myristoyl acyltransferase